MPVLRRYRRRPGVYIVTAIRGNLVTYQVTPEGERQLRRAGAETGRLFGRGVLLDLLRSGDAFTFKGGPGMAPVIQDAERQLEFDFPDDPEPESLIPACAECQSVQDLHLVTLPQADPLLISVLCPVCRGAAGTDVSMPLQFVTRSVLRRILELCPDAEMHPSVGSYQELLDAQFQERWEALSGKSGPTQQSLFAPRDEGGLGLDA